jgi:hypothetical protein
MAATGLADAVRGGPVRQQADDVLELLDDPERCQCVLVTLPETTPVNEVVETAYALEDRVGIQLGPVVVNALDPGFDEHFDAAGLVDRLGADAPAELLDAATFRASRMAMQRDELARLGDELPLPRITLPQLPTAGITPAELDVLVDHLREHPPLDPAPERVS